MAKNFVQEGKSVTVVAPGGGVSSGDPVMIGTLFGVALHDATAGASLEIATCGVWTLPADIALSIDAGDRVFWDSGNGWVDETATAQQCVGVAVEDQDEVAETVKVLLGPVTPTE